MNSLMLLGVLVADSFSTIDRYRNDPDPNEFASFIAGPSGDTGAGLGTSQQTGWTGPVATLLRDQGEGR